MKATLHTRREFLRHTLLGAGLTCTVPQFLVNSFSALHAANASETLQGVTGKDAPILLLVQLAGGNDGLNTVVPYTNDDYYRARPRLGLAAQEVLRLNETTGLHPSLIAFKEFFDAGHLQVVPNVGYPNPNRSHFRSTEIWQTASDAQKSEKYGWVGRYFDNACAGSDPTVGISLGLQTPQAFFSAQPKGISLKNPESYRYQSNATEAAFRQLNQESPAMTSMESSGDSVGAVPGAMRTGAPLEFIERASLDAQVSSDQILRLSRAGQNQVSYPTNSRLAQDLQLIGKLIAGGLPTRIYYVSHGGFDTHTNQKGTHENLLRQLGEGLGAFVADLKKQGNFDRVMIMTFSEFGRRVAENGSGGTDHGAAAPQFLISGRVNPGISGEAPRLGVGDLENGDVKFSTDFRSVYAGVLEQWLRTPSAPILGREFPQHRVV
jgi:uncharacterized protein (DUF1501 family)